MSVRTSTPTQTPVSVSPNTTSDPIVAAPATTIDPARYRNALAPSPMPSHT